VVGKAYLRRTASGERTEDGYDGSQLILLTRCPYLDIVPSGPTEERGINGRQLTHCPVGQVVRCPKLVI
jgi:hypothetical protein